MPRLRMIAGPNGSGKSTLLGYLQKMTELPLGHCQNPDEIEEQIWRTGQLALKDLGFVLELEGLRKFLREHALGQRAWGEGLSLAEDALLVKPGIAGGYFSAVLCDYIRHKWVEAKATFTFETVMSGADKIEMLKHARQSGYRNYLYYICTDSAMISLARVAARVSQGGHGVQREKVEQRYARSLSLLPAAILLSNRAYLFDNSEASHAVVAEYEEGKLTRAAEKPPQWFVKHVLNAERKPA